MRPTPQISLNSKRNNKRLIALAFLICLIVVFMLSKIFILTHADNKHDHNGIIGSCGDCAQIRSAKNMLKLLDTAIVSMASVLVSLFAAIAVIRSAASDAEPLTPVTLKIRLNN